MFLPIGDENQDRVRFPLITVLILLINTVIFFYFQDLGRVEDIVNTWGLVPKEISSGRDISGFVTHVFREQELQTVILLKDTPVSIYLTLMTGFFLHGSIIHFFGNIIYLWIFGDNLENKLGHLKFSLLYILGGLFSALFFVYLNQDSILPLIGSSGAISSVLGAYLVLFPRRYLTIFIFGKVVHIPALVIIVTWVTFQILNTIGVESEVTSNIAYSSHFAGFIFGLVFGLCFKARGI